MPTSRTVSILATSFAVTLLSIPFTPANRAQSASTATAPSEVRSAAPAPAPPKPTPVTGAPFSSVAERLRTQTLAVGTHIDILETVTRTYRDSQGRTRTEFTVMKPDGTPSDRPDSATISDPVAGKTYFLNIRDRTATSAQFFGPSGDAIVTPSISVSGTTNSTIGAWLAPATNANANLAAMPRPEVTSTSLGEDTILGVPVTGLRITIVFPVGMVGNDQPISVIRERWEASDLRLILLSKTSDPREGDTIIRVTQLDRTEPDPSLFQVPPGFKIVER